MEQRLRKGPITEGAPRRHLESELSVPLVPLPLVESTGMLSVL